MNLQQIIEKVRIKGTQNFERDKSWTNTDEGKEMITFCTKTLRTRKVSDWGRDEDEDVYIGLDDNGWIRYEHTIEYLAGPVRIKEQNTTSVTDDYILNYLNDEKCTNEEYLMFMSKSYKYYDF
ncbi:MAG: hypothetical protein E7211_08660 [Clostridium lundense]|nr:hypothetical protein [Clostridium lundense]